MMRYLVTTRGTAVYETEMAPTIGYDDVQEYEQELTDEEAADLASDERILRIRPLAR